jgi:poly-beta-hydroxybutyrate-responsive repressor
MHRRSREPHHRTAPTLAARAAHPAGPPALPRELLPACLLLLIRDKPAYGYDLRRDLAAMGAGRRDWSQVYRLLRGLEREGLTVSCWVDSDSGPARRTYHLTDRGSARLAQWAAALAAGQGVVDGFLARYREAEQREAAS